MLTSLRTPLKLLQRPFGKTALSVSPLGLGTVKFGRNTGVKYPESFSLPEDSELRNLLALSRDWGINLLDTAPAYGHSESRLGAILQGQRHEWVLMSKVGETFEGDQSIFDFSSAFTIQSVEDSLKRLRTDYLDVLLIHSNGQHEIEILEGLIPTLQNLKRQGKIRAFGMSSKTVEGGLHAVEHTDCVMCTYNPMETQEAIVIDHALELQKGVLIKKALASGHLQKLGHEPVRSSFQFIFEHGGVHAVIVGTINPAHLQENVAMVGELLRFRDTP